MRVLFATYSEKTHFLSMVPLAWALRSAGHDVRVASQPELTDAITTAGLLAVPVGEDHTLWVAAGRVLNKRFAEANPQMYKKIRLGRTPPFDLPQQRNLITWEYLRAAADDAASMARLINSSMLADLVGFARAWQPDLVIWEPTTYAAPIAARAVGAPHLRFMWGPDHYGAVRGHFLRAREEQTPAERVDALGGWVADQAARHGVAFDEELITGQATIDQLPTALRCRGRLDYLPLRYVPYGGAAVVPDWLREPPTRTRVALTLGLSATDRFGGYVVSVSAILEALGDLDVEVVATIAEQEQERLGVVPDNVRLVSFVPLHALLATCTAVIHHGGAGTVATTTLLGLPQLIVPDQGDGEFAATRIAHAGAGLLIPPEDADGSSVRAGLVRLLQEPAFAQCAAELRDEVLAMPTPHAVVSHLEEFVAMRKEVCP
ncbi:glycosyl transferase [Streptomyces albus subsp. albus]|nr:glycosyl transferase [Streptomyces albus subsp. albus]